MKWKTEEDMDENSNNRSDKVQPIQSFDNDDNHGTFYKMNARP